MLNWALPYAQRYIYNAHHDRYSQLKQTGFENLCHLQIVVVEKLFYRNVLTRSGIASKKRFECSCLLLVCNPNSILGFMFTCVQYSIFGIQKIYFMLRFGEKGQYLQIIVRSFRYRLPIWEEIRTRPMLEASRRSGWVLILAHEPWLRGLHILALLKCCLVNIATVRKYFFHLFIESNLLYYAALDKN